MELPNKRKSATNELVATLMERFRDRVVIKIKNDGSYHTDESIGEIQVLWLDFVL